MYSVFFSLMNSCWYDLSASLPIAFDCVVSYSFRIRVAQYCALMFKECLELHKAIAAVQHSVYTICSVLFACEDILITCT